MAIVFLKLALAMGGTGLISLLYFMTMRDDPWKGLEIMLVFSVAAAIFVIISISLALASYSC